MIKVEHLLNDEQLMYVACDTIVNNEPNSEIENYATGILVYYVLKRDYSNGQDFTEAELVQKIDELVLDHRLMLMNKDGLIETHITDSGKVTYSVTEKGKAKLSKNTDKYIDDLNGGPLEG